MGRLLRLIRVVVGCGEVVLVGEPQMGSRNGQPTRDELMFEIFGDVEPGGFGDFGRKFQVMMRSPVKVGSVGYGWYCGGSGQWWSASVMDDVFEDTSRRLRRWLISGRNLRSRRLGLLGNLFLQRWLSLDWFRSTVHCRLTCNRRIGVSV